jgi:hypothetical protein
VSSWTNEYRTSKPKRIDSISVRGVWMDVIIRLDAMMRYTTAVDFARHISRARNAEAKVAARAVRLSTSRHKRDLRLRRRAARRAGLTGCK